VRKEDLAAPVAKVERPAVSPAVIPVPVAAAGAAAMEPGAAFTIQAPR